MTGAGCERQTAYAGMTCAAEQRAWWRRFIPVPIVWVRLHSRRSHGAAMVDLPSAWSGPVPASGGLGMPLRAGATNQTSELRRVEIPAKGRNAVGAAMWPRVVKTDSAKGRGGTQQHEPRFSLFSKKRFWAVRRSVPPSPRFLSATPDVAFACPHSGASGLLHLSSVIPGRVEHEPGSQKTSLPSGFRVPLRGPGTTNVVG